MIIRKILDITDQGSQERYQLILEDKEHGWELSKEEIKKLQRLIDKAFEPGAVEKVTEKPVKLTKTEEKITKKNKKPRLAPDLTPYVEMYAKDVEKSEIVSRLQEEIGVTNSTASTYYYTKIKPEGEILKSSGSLEAYSKAKLEQEKNELEAKVASKGDLLGIVKALPAYANYSDFKDACAVADVGRGKYSIRELKDLYLQTHPSIKW